MIDGPDMCDEETSPVLCPDCLRRTHYALNTARYVCPVHGPVITDEALPQPSPPDRRHG